MNREYVKIILNRVLTSVLILFFVVSLVFVVIQLSPGNPAQKYLSPKLSPKLYEKISESYNLNSPVYKQYLTFVKNVFSGNLGVSYNYRQSVVSVIKPYLKFSIVFGTISFLIQIIISFLLVYFVIQNNSKNLENFLSGFNLMLYSIPVFITSLFLIYIFSFNANLFPSSGLTSITFDEKNLLAKFSDYFSHLILPLVASSLVGIPIYYKYFLDSVKTNLNKIFVKNLEAVGVKRRTVLFKHVFPNSINSVIAIAGVEFGVLLGGSVIVETIFGLPGMGRLTMNAVVSRDYPLIIGSVMISAILVLFVNLISDILRAVIDKRLFKGLIS